MPRLLMDQAQPSSTGWFSRFLKIVPVLALLVTAIGLYLSVQARKKEISCEYIGSSRLVSITAGGIPSDVKMEYHGQPVQSLSKLGFVLRNTGSAAIKRDDVLEPIKLVFPPTVRILNSTVDGTSPQQF